MIEFKSFYESFVNEAIAKTLSEGKISEKKLGKDRFRIEKSNGYAIGTVEEVDGKWEATSVLSRSAPPFKDKKSAIEWLQKVNDET